MLVSTHLQIDYDRSPIEPLFDVTVLDRWEASLRAELQADIDHSSDRQSVVFTRSQRFEWFQRIAVPDTRLSTTSDHSRVLMAGGNPLHSLYGRLSDAEGSVPRPHTKWYYIKPHLPELAGKSVLEAGSNCGFFSFEFLRSGAGQVTGYDLVRESVDAANYMADEMGCGANAQFICADFTRSDKAHDVVFMSEVLTHSPCPVSTIYASVLLARETLIIDEFFPRHDAPLSFWISMVEQPHRFGNPDTIHSSLGEIRPGQFLYLAAAVSERLLLTSLRIVGVLPEKVRRLRDPLVHQHALIVVDTRGARERREEELWHPYLRPMIGMER